jgi:hypothetical protein
MGTQHARWLILAQKSRNGVPGKMGDSEYNGLILEAEGEYAQWEPDNSLHTEDSCAVLDGHVPGVGLWVVTAKIEFTLLYECPGDSEPRMWGDQWRLATNDEALRLARGERVLLPEEAPTGDPGTPYDDVEGAMPWTDSLSDGHDCDDMDCQRCHHVAALGLDL